MPARSGQLSQTCNAALFADQLGCDSNRATAPVSTQQTVVRNLTAAKNAAAHACVPASELSVQLLQHVLTGASPPALSTSVVSNCRSCSAITMPATSCLQFKKICLCDPCDILPPLPLSTCRALGRICLGVKFFLTLPLTIKKTVDKTGIQHFAGPVF